MKLLAKLNPEATAIFCQLLDRLKSVEKSGPETYLKIDKPPYMRLSMETLSGGIQTAWGEGTLYSLSHTFVQNGDLMRDPEMTFLVVDNRIDASETNLIGVYPETYQLDSLGIYQKCLIIEDYSLTSYRPALTVKLASFANDWMSNVFNQGYLKPESPSSEDATV